MSFLYTVFQEKKNKVSSKLNLKRKEILTKYMFIGLQVL